MSFKEPVEHVVSLLRVWIWTVFLVGTFTLMAAPTMDGATAIVGERAKAEAGLGIAAERLFSLIDHRNNPVRKVDFRGKYMLIYFGYTYCPDVCPTGLQIMSTAVDDLGPARNKVVPVFITADPDRDTADLLADYVTHFHPALIGLTGTPEMIRDAARAFSVRYFKVFDPPATNDEDEDKKEGANEKDMDEQPGYMVSHSASTYLVGPNGKLLFTFPYGVAPAEMTSRIRKLIDSPS